MLRQIDIVKDGLEIGDLAYSIYVKAWYIVACLPNIIDGNTKYALIRKDGAGYYYLSSSIEKLKRRIHNDGETDIFRKVIRKE